MYRYYEISANGRTIYIKTELHRCTNEQLMDYELINEAIKNNIISKEESETIYLRDIKEVSKETYDKIISVKS